jgi:hypothetical protein
MDEEEWLSEPGPRPMVDYLVGRVSERKLRLYAAAAVRRIWHLLRDERSRNAVEMVERYADGFATNAELFEAFLDARQVVHDQVVHHIAQNTSEGYAALAARLAAEEDFSHASEAAGNAEMAVGSLAGQGHASPHEAWMKAACAEMDGQLALIRCLFGNPFHPVACDPAWLAWKDGTLPRLAESIYQDRSWDLMPILADALEEAGCQEERILAHCRGPGPHARGCFMLDLLLGKS